MKNHVMNKIIYQIIILIAVLLDPLPKVSSVIWNVCDILSG